MYDADFVVHSEEDLQLTTNCFSAACDSFGLRIILRKIKAMFIPPHLLLPTELLKNTLLDVVDTFPYLGRTISRDDTMDAEIFSYIQKTSVAFNKYESRFWLNRCFTIKNEVSLYIACILLKQGQHTGNIYKTD